METWNETPFRVVVPWVVFAVASAGLAILTQLVIASSGLSVSALVAGVTIVVQTGGAGVALLAYASYRDELDTVHYRMPTRRQLVVTAAVVCTLLAINIVFAGILSLLPIESAQNAAVTQGQQAPVLFLYLIPVSLLFIAPVEEFLFRGLIQGALTDVASPKMAIGIASVLFGISHAGALSSTGITALPYVLVAVVLGGVLGTVYEREENLLVPILAHGVYNALLFLSQWVFATRLV